MEKQETSEDRLIALRRAKVAEMLAMGYNQTEIVKACVSSHATISRDVDFLRQQALATMDDYLNDLPLQHAKARLAVDMVLRKAFEMLEAKNSESDPVHVMKVILDATQVKLSFLGDVTALDKSIKQAEAMKKQIADLKKKSLKLAPYEAIETVEPASGAKGKVTRQIRKKEKKEVPVVV